MDLIDRYVEAVTERLPEGTREDVARELRANIEDMLPDNATERDIRAVLEKLGNPAILSNEYRQTKRYLIGPAVYDTYITVLKLVLCIATIAVASLSLIAVAIGPASGKGLVEYIAAFVSGGLQGAIASFLWVTLVFALLEWTGALEGNSPFKKKEWSVDDLPPASRYPKDRISHAEAVVSIVFIVAFMSIILFKPELFGWYESGSSGLQVIPVFDVARLHAYIPAMVALAALQIGMSIYKFMVRRWTLPLAIVNTVSNVGVVVLACLMLSDRSLFNPDLITHMAGVFGISVGSLETWVSIGLLAFMAIIVLGCTIDSIMGFVKSGKLLRSVDVLSKKWTGQ